MFVLILEINDYLEKPFTPIWLTCNEIQRGIRNNKIKVY